MIAYLKGKIFQKTVNSIIIETNGIGYEVFIPTNQLNKYSQGIEIELFTYLHTREDLLQLYGFSNWDEKELFLLLINISGIGPKAALSILSHGSLKQLKTAIGSGDINFLTKLPGIGKKTAQRLIVELKDKMQIVSAEKVEMPEDGLITNNSDIISALNGLGYQETEIKKIYPQLIKENPDADESTLIKKALQLLARI